jgi:hypothetical protein
MNFLYQFLGLVSALLEWASRRTLYFVPLNWFLLSTLLLGSIYTNTILWESLYTNKIPIKTNFESIPQLFSEHKKFITLEGMMHYTTYFPNGGTTKDPSPTSIFVYFAEDSTDNWILVKMEPEDWESKDPERKQITGMLDDIPRNIASEITNINSVNSVGTEFILKKDENPHEILESLLFSLLTTIPFLIMAYTFLKRYTIISINPEKIPQSPALNQFAAFATESSSRSTDTNVSGYITGKLFLGSKKTKMFYDVPTECHFLENGNVVCSSTIDASLRIFGIAIQDLDGIWTCSIDKLNISKIESIYHYYGLHKRKGLFIHFKKPQPNKHLVLSFEKEKDFLTVFNKLYKI